MHNSSKTNTNMTCSVYIPNTSNNEDKIPGLLYLSGLTCTDENVCQKSGIFKYLDEYKLALICPDTSPRNTNIEGDSESWDFGIGAGFYLDATISKWSVNFNMYSYITKELIHIIEQNFPLIDTMSMGITGHSMGGHGALTIGLKNPSMFRSISAFSPICNPKLCPWGKKAFSGYLGDNEDDWNDYDATELIKSKLSSDNALFDDILIDVGADDNFLKNGQLLPENFEKVCNEVKQKLTLRYQPGYDHSYFFVSSFVEDHVKFHAARLK